MNKTKFLENVETYVDTAAAAAAAAASSGVGWGGGCETVITRVSICAPLM